MTYASPPQSDQPERATPESVAQNDLDVVAVGRAGVDLYGEQVGGRLEDMGSFAKYIGGCPTNIAAGTARLGLRSALITRVGDEHMGRFVREELAREGVDTAGIKTDPDRLTALVVLGIRDRERFPLIFYRENCADAALSSEDIDEALIARTRALVVTGTHFAKPNLNAASRRAIELARRHGATVILDIDYRPVLWGLTGHGAGEERFVESASVTEHLQDIVALCDVVVGTEEEIHVAGGATDTHAALSALRDITGALLVCKRGPMGCVVFPGPIPASVENGIQGPGVPVEVFNVLGAGDAFMSGFLAAYLDGAELETCCRWANAAGALAVSRHGCTPASPSRTELNRFLARGSAHRRLRDDAELEQLHCATTRHGRGEEVHALAADHRPQFEQLADAHGVARSRIADFKRLALDALRDGAEHTPGACPGILLDGRYGWAALAAGADTGAWLARPIESPQSRPLAFEGGAGVAATLRAWPLPQVVKCLVLYHPDDDAALRAEQEAKLVELFQAARATRHELLVEVVASKAGLPMAKDTAARALRAIYARGVFPDWWKLEAQEAAGWDAVDAAIVDNDPECRGVLMLGLDAPIETVAEAFEPARGSRSCRGFAIGRTIFGEPARAWFAGESDDANTRAAMAERYRRLVQAWGAAGGAAAGA